jgi:hypothetical protein
MTVYINSNLKPGHLLDNRRLSRKNFQMLIRFAIEAYEIDPSHPISYYFNLFNQRLNKNYTLKLIKTVEDTELIDFFEDEIIEN